LIGEDTNEILSDLRDLSLIEWIEDETGTSFVKIHRVLACVIWEHISETECKKIVNELSKAQDMRFFNHILYAISKLYENAKRGLVSWNDLNKVVLVLTPLLIQPRQNLGSETSNLFVLSKEAVSQHPN